MEHDPQTIKHMAAKTRTKHHITITNGRRRPIEVSAARRPGTGQRKMSPGTIEDGESINRFFSWLECHFSAVFDPFSPVLTRSWPDVISHTRLQPTAIPIPVFDPISYCIVHAGGVLRRGFRPNTTRDLPTKNVPGSIRGCRFQKSILFWENNGSLARISPLLFPIFNELQPSPVTAVSCTREGFYDVVSDPTRPGTCQRKTSPGQFEGVDSKNQFYFGKTMDLWLELFHLFSEKIPIFDPSRGPKWA